MRSGSNLHPLFSRKKEEADRRTPATKCIVAASHDALLDFNDPVGSRWTGQCPKTSYLPAFNSHE
eukprot:scaffold9749_cov148-Skeletonema_menzelii.AAC.4